jgi:predicted alpha/beta-fold hydrolase
MKVDPSERKTPRTLRTLAVVVALAALSPLAVTAFLILYIRARYSGTGVRIGAVAPAPLERTVGVKTMSEVMVLLKAVPFRARVPTRVASALYTLLDTVPSALNITRGTAGLIYPYPGAFEPVVVESHDGTPICGVLAMQPDTSERPAIIFVHGLFSSKNSYEIHALALRAYYEWGFHVFAMDLRNFGDSSRFSEAPTSWGYRESEDILAVAEYLEAVHRVSTVGVCGISMGAGSALIAAGSSRLDRPLAGGVVALNGHGDAERVLERLSSVSSLSIGAVAMWLVFRLLLVTKTLAGGPRPFGDLRAYTREVAAQYYEITEQDLYANASPINAVGDIEVPCLIVHAVDDRIIPVDEAYDLLAAAIDNPMVGSLIVPSGGHIMYEMACPGWFHTTLKIFFTYWAEFGSQQGQQTGHRGGDSTDMFGNSNN